MLRYKNNVLELLKNKGFSSYRLRKDKIMGESKIQNIRNNATSIETIDQLCRLIDCQPGDILEYVPDEDKEIKNTSKDEIQKEQKEEIPKQVTVKEMKKVAQIKTPIKLKKVGNKNKNQNIL